MFALIVFCIEGRRRLSGMQKYSILGDYIRRNEKRGLHEITFFGFHINSLCFVLFEYVNTINSCFVLSICTTVFMLYM